MRKEATEEICSEEIMGDSNKEIREKRER